MTGFLPDRTARLSIMRGCWAQISRLRMMLSATINHVRFWYWRQRNPGTSFSQFYADIIAARLNTGRGHHSLGKRQYSDSNRHGESWTIETFAERGRDQANMLLELGLQPTDRCIDYGCGSLRIGQQLIRLLPPGHYCGLDVTDRFFSDGLSLIDPALIARKQPRLAVIDEAVLAELAQDPADFLFSYAVLKHVPPAEVTAYFDEVTRLIGPNSLACIFFVTGARTMPAGSMSWVHAGEDMLALLRQRYPLLRIDLRELTHGRNRYAAQFNDAVLQLAGRDRAVSD
jgi:SAM-dependent methyltransferase